MSGGPDDMSGVRGAALAEPTIVLAPASPLPVSLSARRSAWAPALAALMHVAAAAVWLTLPPQTSHSADAGVFTVQLLAPPPEPQPEPERRPEPPAPVPQPIQRAPAPASPKAAPAKAAPMPKSAPATPVLAAASAEAATQPVTTASPAGEVAAPSDNASVAVPTPAARAAERDDYLRLIWARIMRFRPERVPFAGTVRLRFNLGADGTLAAADIVESSGSALLDRAALDAVQRAAPFPPPPANTASSPFEIPFHFRRT